MRSKRTGITAAMVATGMLALAAPATASTGGSPTPGDPTAPAPAPAPATATTPAAPTGPTGPTGKAKLLPNGMAVAPVDAPPAVVNAIAAGNAIRTKPYIYGGGHASFTSAGYDCSGAVSYALYGAGLVTSPMPSGGFMKWGLPGKGRWITTYANPGHMYAVIAGLRWDTSAMGSGSGKGPRWRATKRSPRGYAVRHYTGF